MALDKNDSTFLTVSIQKQAHHTKNVALSIEESTDRWVVTSANKTVHAMIKKRWAYPGTYSRQLDATTVQFGYGSEDKDEFLTITLQGTSLTIVRDAFATLPLFYCEQASSFVLSNEYADVVKAVERPIVRQSAIIDHLMMVDRPAPPPIEGVHVLKEQERLVLTSEKGVAIAQPSDRSWHLSKHVPESDPKDFLATFSEYLDYFIESRFAGQAFAFEVSGGLDSATLPQYFYKVTQQPIYMASMLFGAPYDVSQRTKLEAIASGTSATVLSSPLDPATMAPLSSMTTPRYAELIYLEAFLPVVRQLREQGIKVLATGDGGDEFFQNVTTESFGMAHGERAREIREAMKLPEFFTTAFREAYIASSPSAPILPLPHRPANTAFGHLGNNLLIREDIWPVSPFSSPQMYDYIQSIPAHFRANKNILRAFHQAKGFTDVIYNATENEYFDSFFKECFKTGCYDDVVETILPEARTVAMGYVDVDKVRQTYARAKYDSQDEDVLFRLYCFLALEFSLHLADVKMAT